MDRLVTLVFAFIVGVVVGANPRIPGCTDIEELQKNASAFTDFCFCKANSDSSTAALFCTYGSDSAQLLRSLDAINASDFALTQISINHLRWENAVLSKAIALQMGPHLQEMIVGQCGAHGLSIERDAFEHFAETLTTLSIYDCGLKEVPAAVASLTVVKKLSFPDNLITTITDGPLRKKQNLIYLNLEGNFINGAEEGAFEGLSALQTLLIGEHNFANETVLVEMQKLKGLQILDMTKMDGVAHVVDRQFENYENLETLIMKGCSLQAIRNESFVGLRSLKQLDLRLNLIETVANESFAEATELERLSMEGNYLKVINASMWSGLNSLQTLDLGWNELVNLTNDAFSPLGNSLQSLRLANNAKLAEMEENAFEGLTELRILNVSNCRIRELAAPLLHPLKSLETLDFSHNQLIRIDRSVFEQQAKSLRVLKLNDNLLRSVDASFLESLVNLKVVDLSDNPWLCDKRIYPLIKTIEQRYKRAFEQKVDFLLENANNTICSRPYSLRFRSLFDLTEEELVEYNEELDTTTPEATTTASNDTEEETIEATTFNLGAQLIGDYSSNKSFLLEDNRRFSEFDVNERWADDFKTETERNWINFASVGSLVVISAAILATVVHHIKKRRLEESEKETDGSTAAVKMSDLEAQSEEEGKKKPTS